MSYRIISALACLLVASPMCVLGAEPLDMVSKAFHASSDGLTSGIGKGTFQFYEAKAGGEWKLTSDADVDTCFHGKNYRILLIYRKEPTGLTSRLIIHDGKAVIETRFSPLIHPSGATTTLLSPEKLGDGMARPQIAGFPWDVSKLLNNVWNVDRLIKNVSREKIEIEETLEGDLIGSYPVVGSTSHARFECPRRIGHNISSSQLFIDGEDLPVRQSQLEWKRSPEGLWYVTTLERISRLNHPNRGKISIREVLRYTDFVPNPKVDPTVFTQESIRKPEGSAIIDRRVDANEKLRRDR
jgi:hypothetical protein